MRKMTTPLVSICCITYNHAPFIRGCLDGFLMQQMPSCVREYYAHKYGKETSLDECEKKEPWYEILIHDDASTDGTADIIREYEQRHPNLFKPIYETENQYKKGHRTDIDFFNYKRAKGKYIAYCEGDDYWTVPDKLQRQVDFLEAHPAYSVCFHKTKILNTLTNQMQPDNWMRFDYPDSIDEDVTPSYFLRSSVGQPLSMVFRTSRYDYEWQKHYNDYCDTMEIYHLLRTGKGRMMKFIGGQYNLHGGGVSATMDECQRSVETMDDFLTMYLYTRDEELKAYFIKAVFFAKDLCTQNGQKVKFREWMHAIKKKSLRMWLYYEYINLKRTIKSLFV
ncbi:MAG: glycosyltransferase family 2 protein [Paludibacteraceae bacterium]|nr:glycosyltransferase family 2 protein [Paludibacteraceae bacterium]